MGGRTWRNSRDFYCNGLLRKRNPNGGSNGWAPAQASRSAPVPAPEPPRQAESPVSHDFVYDDPARERISTSPGALPQPEQGRGEAYSYYHPKSPTREEHEEAAAVPLPLSGSSSLRDLLKAEENHHVRTRRRFEIEKSFYAPEQEPRQRKNRAPAPQPEPTRPPTRGKEPKRQQSLFKQTMMAISKYTYM